MKHLMLFLLVAAIASPSVADRSPQSVVTQYIEGYSNGIDAHELIQRYWHPSMIKFLPVDLPTQLQSTQFADMVNQFRENVREQSWLRTEIAEIRQCEVRPDLAVVS
jgi:hypothetical protein